MLRENLRFFNHGRISSVSILLDYRAEDHGFDFLRQTVRPILRVLTRGRTRRLQGFSEFFPGNKTSAPDILSSCFFIACTHFETSSVIGQFLRLADMAS